ncbi:MAG TPA: MBL fold metallo-hydrolase [Solirubrobacteraceae bacterium]|nr:MBL fold metallo-hydrolase [Solirubrobacteraceae bacterium]
MRVDWYGQAAFHLSGRNGTVFIDPIGDISGLASRGITMEYPKPEGAVADVVLITHEHADHNGAETIGGDPAVLRSTAGRLESPIGEVVAIASEHDRAAGTERGPNTIFVFDLDGVRVAHFGDFGQSALREEQAAAIGQADLILLPVGGGPVLGAEGAAAIVDRLSPRWVVPMHYRTHRVSFLDTVDGFLERMPHVQRLEESGFDTDSLAGEERPLVVVPAAP